jgi:radical SAM protein with 4Fe4S-binding SPASM domain
VSTRNWWNEAGLGRNPFSLSRSLLAGIRRRASELSEDECVAEGKVKYLWLYVTDSGLHHFDDGGETGEQELSTNDWLNVVDEAASLGVTSLVICVGASLPEQSEIWKICHWAQDVHDMTIGIHFLGAPLTKNLVEELELLDPAKTHLYVEPDVLEEVRRRAPRGISVCEAALGDRDEHRPCSIPESMICVGPSGKLYTCGLVLGDEQYYLGDILEKKLEGVMTDDSLPHTVPKGACYNENGCDACPPLMVKRVTERKA